MGYETRLYVVDEYPASMQEPGQPLTCATLAMINLSKCGYDTATGRLLTQSRKCAERFYRVYVDTPDDWATFDPTGASRGTMSTDPYGDRISAVPVGPLLRAMRQDNAQDPYRRFAWAIAMIESIMSDTGRGDAFRVLQWGY